MAMFALITQSRFTGGDMKRAPKGAFFDVCIITTKTVGMELPGMG